MDGYYSDNELIDLNISFGKNVLISRKTSIYTSNLEIGDNVRIDDFSILKGNIIIGSNVHISSFCQLEGQQDIELESFSGLSSRVSIYTQSDDYSGNFLTNPTVPDKYRNIIKGRVKLEKHVIVGTNSTILPNVILKQGSAVGANSLVNKNLEEWTINVGTPAKKIKNRNNELINFEKFIG